MKAFLYISIILIILLSGCTAQVVDTDKVQEEITQHTGSQPVENIPKPQLTSDKGTAQENTSESEPRVYQVNIVEGIGVAEGVG